MAPCACGKGRVNRYRVIDPAGRCALPKPGGDCRAFTSVTSANRAADKAGLSDYIVQPL